MKNCTVLLIMLVVMCLVSITAYAQTIYAQITEPQPRKTILDNPNISEVLPGKLTTGNGMFKTISLDHHIAVMFYNPSCGVGSIAHLPNSKYEWLEIMLYVSKQRTNCDNNKLVFEINIVGGFKIKSDFLRDSIGSALLKLKHMKNVGIKSIHVDKGNKTRSIVFNTNTGEIYDLQFKVL